jgi:hypothetical protein
VVRSEAAQLALDRVDLLLERVDQVQARRDRRGPRLRQPRPLQKAAPAGAEEIVDRSLQAVLEEDRVHAVLERRALAHQKEAEAGPLPLRPHARTGQPDLGNELPPGELGQHPGIDPIRLARKRRQTLHPLRVRDPHVPTRLLQPVVHEARARHRLDRREDRALLAVEAADEVTKPVTIRRAGTDVHTLAVGKQSVPIETLAAEVKSDVQHLWASFR